MKTQRFYGLVAIFLFSLVTACTPSVITYRLDPEVRNTQTLSTKVRTIAVAVSDNRSKVEAAPLPDTITVYGPKNEAEILKSKLIENLKKENFKITSNQLLADLAVEIQIEQLDTQVVKTFLKSTVKVASQLRLKANKQSQTLNKLYKMSLEQEVANPVNELDVTGVVNQLLSKQLSEIFADPQLAQLADTKDFQEDAFN